MADFHVPGNEPSERARFIRCVMGGNRAFKQDLSSFVGKLSSKQVESFELRIICLISVGVAEVNEDKVNDVGHMLDGESEEDWKSKELHCEIGIFEHNLEILSSKYSLKEAARSESEDEFGKIVWAFLDSKQFRKDQSFLGWNLFSSIIFRK